MNISRQGPFLIALKEKVKPQKYHHNWKKTKLSNE
jgi:hypothetical protein